MSSLAGQGRVGGRQSKKKKKTKKRKENMLRHKGNICPKLLVGSVQIVVVYLFWLLGWEDKMRVFIKHFSKEHL
jgi:hypothetical protein